VVAGDTVPLDLLSWMVTMTAELMAIVDDEWMAAEYYALMVAEDIASVDAVTAVGSAVV
jgi:hypothetical protein